MQLMARAILPFLVTPVSSESERFVCVGHATKNVYTDPVIWSRVMRSQPKSWPCKIKFEITRIVKRLDEEFFNVQVKK